MKSNMIYMDYCRVILLLCFLPSQMEAQESCGAVPRFLTLMNGFYDNREQVKRGTSGADLVEIFLKPVVVPVLNAEHVLVYESLSGGKIIRTDVRVVTEIRPGVVQLIPYNITNSRYIKPPPELFDVDFSTLGRGDIKLLEGCKAQFESFDEESFVGGWDICLDQVNGHYGATISCDEIYSNVPQDAPESYIYEPYVFVRLGTRFTVPGEENNCANICSNKNAITSTDTANVDERKHLKYFKSIK